MKPICLYRRTALAAALLLCAVSAAAAPGYYRFPSLQGRTLAFVAEGDLWLAPLAGGPARRLTSTPGEERTPFISPNGRSVAFVATTDGPAEVYVMPTAGGVPRRATFEQADVRLRGWIDDDHLLYASSAGAGPSGHWRLRTLSLSRGRSTDIALADAIAGAYDDDGRTLYFTRFGLGVTGDNARIYRGGAMGQLWRYAVNGGREAVRLPTRGSVRWPMWARGRLYFLSDADGHPNIWSAAADGGDRRQLTHFTRFSVRRPVLNHGRIVFQLGADIRWLDLDSDRLHRVAPELTSDFRDRRAHWVDHPMQDLTAVALSGEGDRAVVTARGHVATIGTDAARIVDLAPERAPRLRAAVSGPNDDWIYAISDATGVQEIWRFPADGAGSGEALTHDGDGIRWSIHPSPDGRWLAHDDEHGQLWLLNLETGDNRRVLDRGTDGDALAAVRWSPDSRYLAIALRRKGDMRERLVLYGLAQGKRQVLTSDRYRSFSPAFSADGRWLYFLSDRRFTPSPASPWGDRNLGPAFAHRTEIFALALKKDAPFPFAPPTGLDPLIDDAEGDDPADESRVPAPTTVDWNGLARRLWRVPVQAGDYSALSASDERLYILDRHDTPDAPGHDEAKAETRLRTVKIERRSPETKTYAEDVYGYRLSLDGQRLLLRRGEKGRKLLIVDGGDKLLDDRDHARVRTHDWGFEIQPMQEWRAIFDDAWLMHESAFFDPQMRGVDWRRIKQRYAALLPRLTDRADLNDVLAQMKGELSAMHSQVRGGDLEENDEATKSASLGARLEQTGTGVRIAHIYRADAELPDRAPPLARPGVDAAEGDVVVALNGRPVAGLAALDHGLRNKADRQVRLTLERGGRTHDTVVTPVDLDTDVELRYRDWAIGNRRRVAAATHGRIGYLHLYAMGSHDIAQFVRDFYAQYRKPALIIDVRRNRGGNIDSWVIEQLMRRPWMFWQTADGDAQRNMQQAFHGHLVVLTDALTYSDGETFSAGIKSLGIAPLIGQRTAGAGVWLSDSHTLADQGHARIAEFPQFDLDGRWLIENTGVRPDIAVVNPPHASYEGQDAQLERGIRYLKHELENDPIEPLSARPVPTLSDRPAMARPVKPLGERDGS